MKLSTIHPAKLSGTFVLLSALCLTPQAHADSGPYVGGSLGRADTDIDFSDLDDFDDGSTAWKVFGGYNFDVLLMELGVEGSYVDFGSPSDNLAGANADLDMDAFTGFGVAGIDLGLFGFFAKLGVIRWDADAQVAGLFNTGDSGTDPAYGIGASFNLRSIEVRAEYEKFDIDVDGAGSSDVSMISAGVAWTF